MIDSLAQIGWYPDDIKKDSQWIKHLSSNEKNIMEEYLSNITLESCSNKIAIKNPIFLKLKMLFNDIFDATINKRGFILIKNFPVPNKKYPIDVIRKFYLEFCQHLGAPLIQNKKQDYLYDVKEINIAQSDPNVRGAQVNSALPLHADHGGLLGMYCLHSAELGGDTLLGSTYTIHNEIRKTRPDLLKILYEPFYGDRRGQEPKGQLPYDINPIFAIKENQLLCQYVGIYYTQAPDKFPHIPKLTQQQIDALNLFDEISNRKDIVFEVKLNPGDVIFINNNKVLHGRTAFQNVTQQTNKRHLLRIWLSTPKIKSFPHYYGYPMP